jgi:hypothetical protein
MDPSGEKNNTSALSKQAHNSTSVDDNRGLSKLPYCMMAKL